MLPATKKISLIISVIIFSAIIVSVPLIILLDDPSITGFTITKTYVKGLEVEHECRAEFHEAWNLISIPCLAPNKSAENVLSSIAGNFSSVHAYYAEDKADPWKAYKPGLPEWVVHDLKHIDQKRGYWINMHNKSSFYVEGIIIQPDEISLKTGWNLIGYPANQSKNISGALEMINSSFEIIWSYDAAEEEYYYFNSSSNDGTIEDMEPFRGYWIKMSEDRMLYVI